MQQVLYVVASFMVDPRLTFVPAPLPNGVVGQPYPPSSVGTVSNGVGPYTFSVPPTVPAGLPNAGSPNALPSGMTLSAAGILAGTPTTAGLQSFTISITDSGTP